MHYQIGLKVSEKLEKNDDVEKLIGDLHQGLGVTYTELGDYEYAHESFKASQTIYEKKNNEYSIAIVKGNLGYLAIKQKKFNEAIKNFQDAYKFFHRIEDLSEESTSLSLLGTAFVELRQWEKAEQAFRKSAQIREAQGNLVDAVKDWDRLALINRTRDKFMEAEEWYRKVIKADKYTGDLLGLSITLSNLADLLFQDFSDRIIEARQLAEESLEIKKSFDPEACMIWQTYEILARIADLQGEGVKAQNYHRYARQTYYSFEGTQYELHQNHASWIIINTVNAVQNIFARRQFESELQQAPESRKNFLGVIRRILNGQRNEDDLCKGLNMNESLVIVAILRGIADPETLQRFLK